MATVWAISSGNVSDGANWNTGVVPGIGDDVYADGKDMVVDLENWSIKSLRTTNRGSGTVGGTFTFPTSTYVATLTGFYSGTPYASYGAFKITANSPDAVTLIGNICNYEVGGTTCIGITGNCDVSIIGGTINNSAYGSYAIYYNSTSGGTVTHVGNMIQSGGYGLALGHQYSSVALIMLGTGNYIHTGNLSSANCEAVTVRGTGYFSSTGTATSSTTMPAIYSTGANNVYYNGVLIMQTPPAAQIPVIYQGTTGTGCVYFKGIAINKSTTMAIYAIRMGLMSTGSTQWTFKDELGVDKTLYSTDSGMFGYPAEGDTRDGVIYGQANEFLGSLKVAPPASVVENVPTDHTVGSYKLTQSNIEAYVTNAVAAIKARTDLIPDHPASVESTGGQIGAIMGI